MKEYLPSPRSDGSSAQDSTDLEHELGVTSKQNVCTWCASVAVTDPMYRSSDLVITVPNCQSIYNICQNTEFFLMQKQILDHLDKIYTIST